MEFAYVLLVITNTNHVVFKEIDEFGSVRLGKGVEWNFPGERNQHIDEHGGFGWRIGIFTDLVHDMFFEILIDPFEDGVLVVIAGI